MYWGHEVKKNRHEVPKKTAATIYFNALGDERNRSSGNYDVSSSDFIFCETNFPISHFLLPLQISETEYLITTNDTLQHLKDYIADIARLNVYTQHLI